MTETVKPLRCHFDRELGERVTSRHRDDCPTPTDRAHAEHGGRQ